MNTVCLVGRPTKAPTLELKGDKERTDFILAVQRQNDYTKADFILCQAWGHTAQWLVRNITKGQAISIVGRIHTSSYEEKGKKKYSTIVVVEHASFAG